MTLDTAWPHFHKPKHDGKAVLSKLLLLRQLTKHGIIPHKADISLK
jgi:hypothetical protein